MAYRWVGAIFEPGALPDYKLAGWEKVASSCCCSRSYSQPSLRIARDPENLPAKLLPPPLPPL